MTAVDTSSHSSRSFSSDDSSLSTAPSLEEPEQHVVWDFALYLPESEHERMLVLAALEAIFHFSIKALQYAYKEPRCNCVLSPASLAVSMGILVAGSYGQTQSELMKVAFGVDHISESELRLLERVTQNFLHQVILANDDMATKTVLYYGKGIFPYNNFMENLKQMFSAETKELSDRKAINEYFKCATHGKVVKTVYNTDKTSSLLLVTALHFKSTWKVKFSDAIKSDQFYTEDSSIKVFYMETKALLRTSYESELGMTVVELPLSTCDLSFLIFLPDKGSSMEALFTESASTECLCDTLTNISRLSKMEQTPTKVVMPRMVVEHTKSFRNFLENAGLDESLTIGRANFNNISSNYKSTKTALTDLVTKTVIDITNENYTPDPFYELTAENGDVENVIVNRAFFFALTSTFDTDRRLFLAFGFIKNLGECGATSPGGP